MKLTNDEIDEILSNAGLIIDQPYNENGKYRKDEYVFTLCSKCGTEAHYRLKYILEKNGIGEPVCRACYWRKWYGDTHELYSSAVTQMISQGISRSRLIEEGVICEEHDTGWDEAKALAMEHGYELVDLIRGARPGEDVMVVRCKGCGRQTAERPCDVGFGCSCGGELAHGGIEFGSEQVKVERKSQPLAADVYQDGTPRSLRDSGSPCLVWWDHSTNDEAFYDACTARSRESAKWICPECGQRFSAPVYAMAKNPRCPYCTAVHNLRFDIEWDELSHMTVEDFPDLLAAWNDSKDPRLIPVTYTYPCHLRCPNGHNPTQTPYSYLTNGCMVCRSLATKAKPDQHYLVETDPELAAEWYSAEDGDSYTPENVKDGSKRNVLWRCMACGHTWTATVRDRQKRENNRCPSCGKVMGSLAWKYPQLAAEWSPENPVSPWNTKPFGQLDFTPKWICANNPEHTWTATTAARINSGKGCPVCEHQQSDN